IVAALSAEQWRWGLITGLLLTGYVATWFAALKRAPASVVTAVLVVGAPVTAGLQAIQAGTVVVGPVAIGQLLVLVAGAALVAAALRRRAPASVTA
ncbi:MAG TPA: hypothetical protein VNH13_07510, partial [Candidatus Acidoferrales bacterium]|nr:hypothetical protein [Candidatus Acidoferrales bacterium]